MWEASLGPQCTGKAGLCPAGTEEQWCRGWGPGLRVALSLQGVSLMHCRGQDQAQWKGQSEDRAWVEPRGWALEQGELQKMESAGADNGAGDPGIPVW